MNKAQELCQLASNVDIEDRTKLYLHFLLEMFEDEAEKGKFEDEVYFSSVRSWNANLDRLIELLQQHGFDVTPYYEHSYLLVSWSDK